MKVRKFLFVGALIAASLFSVNSVMAEDVVTPTRSESASVTVNLKFKPVMSIMVNAASDHQNIDFLFDSQSNYNDGVTVPKKEKHLNVFSTGGFQVSLQTSGENFISGNTNITIPVKEVTVTATASEGNKLSYALLGAGLELSNSSTPFIQSVSGGRSLDFDVEYKNPGFAAAKYINGYDKDFLTGEATVFKTTLTYTIATN